MLWMLMPLAHRSSKAFPGPSWVVDRQLAFSYNQDVEKVSTTNSSSWMSSLRLLPYRDPVNRLVLPSYSAACNEGIAHLGCSRFSIREQSPPDPRASVYVSALSLLPIVSVRSSPKRCRSWPSFMCKRNILILDLKRYFFSSNLWMQESWSLLYRWIFLPVEVTPSLSWETLYPLFLYV